ERRQADVSLAIADNAMMTLAPDTPPLRKMSLKAGRKETVASVARRYRLSPVQVAAWNSTSAGASFKPGQTVVVYVANKVGGRKEVVTASAARKAKTRAVAVAATKRPAGPPSTRVRVATKGKASGKQANAGAARAGGN
ncbi:MAG: lytic transglycosylase, partial [Pseudomonadota bacterium]